MLTSIKFWKINWFWWFSGIFIRWRPQSGMLCVNGELEWKTNTENYRNKWFWCKINSCNRNVFFMEHWIKTNKSDKIISFFYKWIKPSEENWTKTKRINSATKNGSGAHIQYKNYLKYQFSHSAYQLHHKTYFVWLFLCSEAHRIWITWSSKVYNIRFDSGLMT